jgi:hypothetical protein
MEDLKLTQQHLAGLVLGVMVLAMLSYVWGVHAGSSKSEAIHKAREAEWTIEVGELKATIHQLQAERVSAKVQAAADSVLDCEATCAEEVASALAITTELLCDRPWEKKL